jgi:hypothetical protein
MEPHTPLELGMAFARMYLEQEFGYSAVELIEPADSEDRHWRTRSFWINFQGPQRISFTTQVLQDPQHPEAVLRCLRGWELADYIRKAGRVPVLMTTEGSRTMDEQ